MSMLLTRSNVRNRVSVSGETSLSRGCHSLRVAAALVLTLACLASSADAALPSLARSAVGLVSATFSSDHVVHVRGTVRPAVEGVHVSLQLRIAHTPARQSWKSIGDSVPLSVSGTFSISASVQAGESTVVIRVVLMRGHQVVDAGRADVVSIRAERMDTQPRRVSAFAKPRIRADHAEYRWESGAVPGQ